MTRSLLTNQFLIAMPSLSDPHFRQSVSYICEHSEQGTIGIVINRPMQVTLSEVFRQLNISSDDKKISNLPVYFGGPLHQQRGFVIHTPTAQSWRSSITTDNQIIVTTSQDILEAIALGKGPDQFLVALGYAGWDASQIETEISENTWLTCAANPGIIFDTKPADRWTQAARLLGIDINALSGDIGHA